MDIQRTPASSASRGFKPTFASTAKAIGALLLAEVLLSVALLLQLGPAYLSGIYNMDVTYHVIQEKSPSRIPLEVSFGAGSELHSIRCDWIDDYEDDTTRPLRCRFVSTEIFHARHYLESLGLELANRYSGVSIWPRWGTADGPWWQGIWQLALAALLIFGWRKWSGSPLRVDFAQAQSWLSRHPFTLLLPFAAQVTIASLMLVVVQHPGGIGLGGFPDGNKMLFAALLTAVVAAPFLEEVIFRGILFDFLCKFMGWKLAAVFGSISFTAMHSMQLVGGSAPIQATGLFAVSIALFWLRKASGSLGICVLAHSVTNVIVFATYWRQLSG